MDSWILFGLINILCGFGVDASTSTLTLHNTTTACLRGPSRSPYLQVDCGPFNPFGLVVIHRVLHGLTPFSRGCSLTPSKEACCPDSPNPAQDCVFLSQEETSSMQERCDGNLACTTTELASVVVGESCAEKVKEGVSYDNNSYFALVEFSCVNADLLADVCTVNETMSGQTLYLDSNFFHNNKNHADGTCSCVVLTACQQALVFEVLEADLNTNLTDQTCRETLVLTEGSSGSILTTLNCSSRTQATMFRQGRGGGIGGNGGRFQSTSNAVSLELQVSGSHTGRLLLRVTATNGGPVQVMCGQADSQALLNQTECDASDTTTPTPGPEDVSSPTFNTTNEACLDGLGGTGLLYDFEISCLGKRGAGLISVDRVFHGVTPTALGCSVLANKSSCCPGFKPSRDCLFTTDEGLAALRKSCDGYEACTPRLTSAYVPPGGCPPKKEGNYTYRTYSSFAFVEYSCINVGLMTDICGAGNIVRSREVYLETNVYHENNDKVQPNCPCVVSTACGQSLLFYPMLLELSTNKTGDRACLERVTMEDAENGSVRINIDCASNKIDEVPAQNRSIIFQSQSNVVNFSLHLQSNNEGKILFKVVATQGSTVEVRCGRTTDLPLWKQHQCLPTSGTGPATGIMTTPSPQSTPSATTTAAAQQGSIPPSATTTTTQQGSTIPGGTDKDSDKDSDRDTIIAIVAGVVAFIVVIVFIVIIIFICRGRRSRSEEVIMDDISVSYDPNPYEATPVLSRSGEPVSFENRTYDNVTIPAYTSTNGAVNSEKQVPVMNGDTTDGYQPDFYPMGLDSEAATEGAVGGIDNPVYATIYDEDNILNESKPVVKE